MFDRAPRLSLPDETGRRLRTTLQNGLLERFIDRVDAAAPDTLYVGPLPPIQQRPNTSTAPAEKPQ